MILGRIPCSEISFVLKLKLVLVSEKQPNALSCTSYQECYYDTTEMMQQTSFTNWCWCAVKKLLTHPYQFM